MSRIARLAWLAGLASACAKPAALPASPVAAQPALAEAAPIGANPFPTELPDDEVPLPLDPGVQTGTFDNGLTWYIEPHPAPTDRAELRLVVRAGSALEDADQRGLAHAVEHMAFNGTEHFPGNTLVDYLESIGASFGAHLNAQTGFEETIYQLSVPAHDTATLDRTLLVLRDWATGVSFDPVEVDKERGVILEEWRQTRGASGRTLDAFVPYIFHGSAYTDRLPIGTKESLEGFAAADVRRFYEDWYRPDLMAVIAVGDFDAEYVRERIEHHFGTIEAPEAPRPRPEISLPAHAPLYAVASDPEVSQPSVQILEKRPWSSEADHGAYRRLLTEALFEAMLAERLSEAAQQPDSPFLAAGVRSLPLSPTTWGHSLSAVAVDGRVEEATSALLVEARRAQTLGFTEGELLRARVRLLNGIERAWQEQYSTASRVCADEIVRHYLTPEAMPGIDYEFGLYLLYLSEIGLEAIDAYADAWMTGENRVVAVEVPRRPESEVPTAATLALAADAAKSAPLPPLPADDVPDALVADEPKPGEVVSRRLIEGVDVVEWELSNGIKIVVKPTQFRADDVRFLAWSWGGHSLVADEDYVAANTATAIAERSGVGELDRAALDRYLAGHQVWVSPFIEEDQEGLIGQSTTADLETLLQLVHLYFTSPRFDESSFRVERQQRGQVLANRLAEPAAVFDDAVNAALWQDHPRRRAWTEKTLKKMDLVRSRRVFEERFADPGDFTFVFVGNLEPSTFEPLVETWLASLPAVDRDETWKDVGARHPAGVAEEVVHKGIDPQARVLVTFHGEFPPDRVEEHALSSLTSILETRLREVIREDLGGTYDVSVRAMAYRVPVDAYRLTIAFSCDPVRVDELRAALFAEIERLRTVPMPPAYVDAVKEQQRRAHESALYNNAFWLGALVTHLQEGEELDWILKTPELAAALDPAAVQRAAERWLDPAQRVEVVLLPDEKQAAKR